MEYAELTAEQADAFEDVKRVYPSIERIVNIHTSEGINRWTSMERKALNEVPLDTLLRAYYVGYEIKRTPEENVMLYYRGLDENDTFERGEVHGIDYVLKTLNITIKGINDNE